MAGVQVRPVPEDEKAQSRGPPRRSKCVPTALQPRGSPSPEATPHSLFSLPLARIATADAHPTDDFDGD